MDFDSSSGNLNNSALNLGRSGNSSYITDASPASSKSRSPSGLGGTSQVNYVSISFIRYGKDCLTNDSKNFRLDFVVAVLFTTAMQITTTSWNSRRAKCWSC